MKKIIIFFTVTLFLHSCDFMKKQNETTAAVEEAPKPLLDIATLPKFNADSAYSFIEKQVAFGHRIPNTKEHAACGDWLIKKLGTYCDTVFVQKADVIAFDKTVLHSRNIIGSFNPTVSQRIILAAHWDTRPFADQDTKDQNKPIDGANDGASGVGILLEVARNFAEKKPNVGVDIVLFDSEDYGQPQDSELPYVEDSYCLGSQYWSNHLHVPNYTAKYGILLDMCGAKGSTFTKEGYSMFNAGYLVDRVWKNAAALGHNQYFTNTQSQQIIDDHVYVNRITGIPFIDIIHRTENTPSGFWQHWHTHEDKVDKMDKNVLKAVGETLIYTAFEE